MKVSLEWLNRYVDLQGETEESISRALTMVGFEVESVKKSGLPPLDHVVVGEITSYDQHPNADRLSLCQVTTGEGLAHSIVCGARNFKSGDRVIVALPGAELPGGFKIKKSKLRGIESEGMLCSEKELGLGEDHDGIAILVDRPELGTPINALYPEEDLVFDVEVTPNRPDALSHLGIARELAAWFGRGLEYPEIECNLSAAEGEPLVESIITKTEENCPHYRGYSIRNVKVGASPDWLKRSLLAIGLRPINNIVDITNYVLHETGQPLHAFDSAKIKGDEIVIRQAQEKEVLITLDDKKRELDQSVMVIADAERALVVAGVMGSVDAEVDESSRDIFLEAAYFNPLSVRRTSRQLGLSTDSSYRFERGVDPKGAEYAALRCIDLILEICGGELCYGVKVAGEPPMTEREIELDPDFVRERLGFEIDNETISRALEGLELDVLESEDKTGELVYRVGIPSFRLDLYRPIDLVEEVLRIYGSDRIPEGEIRARATIMDDDPVVEFTRKINHMMAGKGFNETVHYTLRSEDELRRWYGHVQADNLAISNPLASDASRLRTSVVPGLLDCLALNLNRFNEVDRIFESGRVYREFCGEIMELVGIGFLVNSSGNVAWGESRRTDYYTTSQIVLEILNIAGIKVNSTQFEAIEDENPWQFGHAAHFGDMQEGYEAKFGLLDVGMTREWGISEPVYGGALYFLPEFLKRPVERTKFEPFSLFPPAVRDLALLVDASVPAGRVQNDVESVAHECLTEAFHLESLKVFDVYLGKELPESKKSIALSLVFRSQERTLKDKEVNSVFDNMLKKLESNPEYQIRQ